jgi:hypothetical protein
MNQEPSESPREHDLPILTGGQFVDWHTRIADELDTEAMELQMRLEADPSLEADPAFQGEVAALRAKVDLVNRVGEDFSNFSVTKSLERFLKENDTTEE